MALKYTSAAPGNEVLCDIASMRSGTVTKFALLLKDGMKITFEGFTPVGINAVDSLCRRVELEKVNSVVVTVGAEVAGGAGGAGGARPAS
jgi:hypothetical protein